MAEGKRDWYVLHVKPRTEKKVADYLKCYGYFCHLPLYLKVTRVQRRKVRRELPLFPGYVFTRLFPDERVRMLKTNLIVQTIPVPRPRRMIHQLRQISRAGRAAPELKPVSVCAVGDTVRIVSGPLYGTEGVVIRRGRETTLCLNVEILGAAVEVSVSAADLEKVSP
jgi:transcription antitermination factor NusG